MKVIHVQSVIETIFGYLDEDGNVVRKVPVKCEVHALSRAAFDEAFEKLAEARDGLAKEQTPQIHPEPKEP